MKQLVEAIQVHTSINEALKAALETGFTLKKIPKESILVREGQYCQKLFFIESGTVRNFYEHNEKDVTSWFYNQGQFFTTWYSFYLGEPSFENIETLEDCLIYNISKSDYEKLLDQFPKLERFARKLAEYHTAAIDKFSKGYMFLSALERYQLLLSINPDIEQKAKLGHIASFLGISQATLSRIRGKKS